MRGDRPLYTLDRNGTSLGKNVSIREVLQGEKFDVVTFQQVSTLSGNIDTYFPYLEELSRYVKVLAPEAKIFIHETWPYEDGSERLLSLGYKSSYEMYSDIEHSYEIAAKRIGADGIIHSGKAVIDGINLGLKVHRDSFHASLAVGRYLVALVWYKTLCSKDALEIPFYGFDSEITKAEKDTVEKIVAML
jgi:hypothetical protein